MRMNRLIIGSCVVLLPVIGMATNNPVLVRQEMQANQAKNIAPTLPATKPVATPAVAAADAEVPFDVAANQQFIWTMLDQSLDVPTKGIGFGKYLQLSGVLNGDASYWGKPYFGMGARDHNGTAYADLSTANLNLNGHFGNWVSAHVGGLYMNGHSPTVMNYRPIEPANHHVGLEDAYVNIANFNKTPFYLKVGQMFTPFGRYQRYPITQTLTQVLTQTDLPAAQVGYISSYGLYATVSALSGQNKINKSNSFSVNDYAANLGYQNFRHGTDYDFGVSFLNNMADVDAVRAIARDNGGYSKSVPAVNLYGDIYAGPFGFGARYVTAVKRFNAADYQYTNGAKNEGAKPYAADFDASFKFNTRSHRSIIDVFYQLTGQAYNTSVNINSYNVTKLPHYRWGAQYGVNIIKDLAFYLQYYQDKNYQDKNGGNGKRDNVVTARLSFAF